MTFFKRNSLAIYAIAAVVILALAFVLFSSKSTAADEKKTTPPKPALTVTTAQPQQASLPIALAANGNITAWQEAIVGSEASGLRLREVRANVGDRVRAGQVLASFASEPVLADLAQAKAALAEADANAADATNNAERARTLQSTGALSTQQINQYLTTAQTAQARVEAARASLAVQQLRLRQTQVLAPDAGVISSRTATVGAVVASGTELFRLIRQGRLEWRAEVTSTELGRLIPGTTAKVTAANGTQLQGKVRMVAPTVDPQTRAALVYVDLPTSAGASAPVQAGMFAKGEFEMGASAALTVPQQSVVVRDGFSYVFRLGADNRVSQLKVQTGRRLGDRVEVLGGIAPDAVLVASGAGFLNDGDLVKNVAAAAISEPNKPLAGASATSSAPKK
ncbi:MAG: efflux RND transporter periplasmic adaptor subunit [Pseudomonadota bacterium]